MSRAKLSATPTASPTATPAAQKYTPEQVRALVAVLGVAETAKLLGVAAEPVATAPAPVAKPVWPSFLVTPENANADHGVSVAEDAECYTVRIWKNRPVLDQDAVNAGKHVPGKTMLDPGLSAKGTSKHLANPPTIGMSPDGKTMLKVQLFRVLSAK
jgi:hypothetical protein